MFNIIKPGTKFDFMGRSGLFLKISLVSFVLALVAIFGAPGLRFGLDFSGGHEVLIEMDQPVEINEVRSRLQAENLGDTSVQSFEIPNSDKTHFLVRVQRSERITDEQVKGLETAYRSKYGDKLKEVRYNKEIGNIVEVELTTSSTAAGVDTSTAAVVAVITGQGHGVRLGRKIGRPDQALYSVTLEGVDIKVVEALRPLDASAKAARVEFVGPTVGKQLRDDGILAIVYALLCILIYVALRFDFFFGPGAVLCLFHDAVVTVGILALLGQEFSLATIAGLLTLVGYSINDTIIVFDRVRETVGRAQGHALSDVLNKAINETLSRTVMTSFTTFLACICLMIFGRGTVLFEFGLIMAIGVVLGTYSSIYVASPLFMILRERFGPRDIRAGAKSSAGGAPAKSGA